MKPRSAGRRDASTIATSRTINPATFTIKNTLLIVSAAVLEHARRRYLRPPLWGGIGP